MIKTQKITSILNAALLIAGICIGISYLSMPIVTGIAGFVPAVVTTCLIWFYSLSIGLLYAEAILGQPEGANLFTISRNLLGVTWMWILAVVFFISMITYLTSYIYYAAISVEGLIALFHPGFSTQLLMFFIALGFAFIVFLGTSRAARVNFVLMLALILSFIFTLTLGTPAVTLDKLSTHNWIFILFAVPSLFSALGYSAILPPICTYLNREPKKIRLAIFIGTLVPLCVYIAWQWFMIGAVEKVTYWILNEEGFKPTTIIELIQRFPRIIIPFKFILFFSMATSIIGNGLSVVDFLFDGLHVRPDRRKGGTRCALVAATFLLPTLFALFSTQLFLEAVPRFAAPVGEILTNGIIPVWMVAIARYYYNSTTPQLLPGKHYSLFLLALTILLLIYLEGIVFIKT